MKPRVLILSTTINQGGADNQILHLSRALLRDGYEIQLVSMLTAGPMGEEAGASGVPITSLDMRKGVPDPQAVVRLYRILRQQKPHILHSFMFHANLLARLTRLLYRVPIQISSIRNIYEGGGWRETAYRLTNPLCDMATQVSKLGAERYIKEGIVPANKLVTIPNGVDTGLFRPDPDLRQQMRAEFQLGDAFTWLAMGRFTEQKNFPNMIQAFARVVSEKPHSRLLLVGYGHLQPELERLVVSLEIADRVRFVPFRRDVPAVMNAADAYVMSSDWEGMPNVLLEASATGLPIVATNVAGNPEIVIDGKNGFLVPIRDSEALAQAMLKVMNLSETERRQMGAASLAHAEANFRLEHVAKLWKDLYRELLARKKLG
jgi:glycosyltransferase involved in cell wall biosynthesis